MFLPEYFLQGKFPIEKTLCLSPGLIGGVISEAKQLFLLFFLNVALLHRHRKKGVQVAKGVVYYLGFRQSVLSLLHAIGENADYAQNFRSIFL